jgi:hypothetical protein
VRDDDAAWRVLFEAADAVSEGGARVEGSKRVWYGSTSLILALPEPVPASERAFLVAVAERSLHVRVRAVRVARREAQSRAPAALGRATCEIHVSPDPRGLRIDVDVQAPLIEKVGAAGS